MLGAAGLPPSALRMYFEIPTGTTSLRAFELCALGLGLGAIGVVAFLRVFFPFRTPCAFFVSRENALERCQAICMASTAVQPCPSPPDRPPPPLLLPALFNSAQKGPRQLTCKGIKYLLCFVFGSICNVSANAHTDATHTPHGHC